MLHELFKDPLVLAFIPMAVILTVTPGADTLLVVRSVLMRGRSSGVVTSIGICSGLLVHALVSSLGLSMILVRSATAFNMVKYAGAAYIVWLGIQSLRHGLAKTPSGESCEAPGPGGVPVVGMRKAFWEGFLTNVLNPKVAVFYLALLPQFIRPSDPVLVKTLVLTSIHGIMGLCWLMLLALFLGRMRAVIGGDGFRKKLESVAGAVFIGMGIKMALEHE